MKYKGPELRNLSGHYNELECTSGTGAKAQDGCNQGGGFTSGDCNSGQTATENCLDGTNAGIKNSKTGNCDAGGTAIDDCSPSGGNPNVQWTCSVGFDAIGGHCAVGNYAKAGCEAGNSV